VFILSSCYALEYFNPLVAADTPDPGVIFDISLGAYVVATTTINLTNVDKFPIRVSSDLVNWKEVGYVFPDGSHPIWTNAQSDFWAPEIHYISATQSYAVFFAARDTTGLLCVGVAFADDILGPFEDIGTPLIRNSSVGMIDPTYWYEESTDKQYVIWKEDGNGRVPPEMYTPIWLQELSLNASALVGERTEILANDPSSWEGILVEGPWLIKPPNSSYYFLFYSGNGYATPAYALGVARSENLFGPYVKYYGNPIVHSNTDWSGPGHCSVVQDQVDDESYFLIYHSWVAGHVNDPWPRVLMMDSIEWVDGWPTIENSSPSNNGTAPPTD